jgi:citrate/tricarballylate utilization protein
MLPADLVRQGQHVMTVCNSCRYCEGYCPVFPAMEDRLTFAKSDLTYLANLCHNCGECLYACQYAPPHEFGINVPRTLAEIRVASYEEYCWPPALSGAFRRQPLLAAMALAAGLALLMFLTRAFSGEPGPGDFYQVVPHHVMVTLFGVVSMFAVAALAIGHMRFRRDVTSSVRLKPDPTYEVEPDTTHLKPGATYEERKTQNEKRRIQSIFRGAGDALTLRHLHGAGADCTDAEESRGPWRRWLHHCTFYGFALCFASTSVAAVYHLVFGWRAPYAYTSLPVVLGTAGGIGLLVGPAGLFAIRQVRDEALADPGQRGLDLSFIAMLFLTSLTGLGLMALREGRLMPSLLVIHLASVLALFLMLPYGKFVHGIYRMAALVKFAHERDRRA